MAKHIDGDWETEYVYVENVGEDQYEIFRSPDGIGRLWYSTVQEALEDMPVNSKVMRLITYHGGWDLPDIEEMSEDEITDIDGAEIWTPEKWAEFYPLTNKNERLD
jgi:hypothetical protein